MCTDVVRPGDLVEIKGKKLPPSQDTAIVNQVFDGHGVLGTSAQREAKGSLTH